MAEFQQHGYHLFFLVTEFAWQKNQKVRLRTAREAGERAHKREKREGEQGGQHVREGRERKLMSAAGLLWQLSLVPPRRRCRVRG